MKFQIDDGPRRLEPKITRKGIEYERVDAAPTYFIYSAKIQGSPRQWFEVFQKRINAAHIIADHEIPASEAWPSDYALGVWAWTFESINAAIAKAQTIKPHKSTLLTIADQE